MQTPKGPRYNLYRCFDAAGRLLYIGITRRGMNRAIDHHEKPWWDEVATMTWQRFATRAEVMAAERDAIMSEAPAYNIAHKAATVEVANADWDRLVEREPRLLDLLNEARSWHPPTSSFCANEVWYGSQGDHGMRGQLQQIVGWAREPDPVLGTTEAFALAMRIIYGALPDCVSCTDWGCRG